MLPYPKLEATADAGHHDERDSTMVILGICEDWESIISVIKSKVKLIFMIGCMPMLYFYFIVILVFILNL